MRARGSSRQRLPAALCGLLVVVLIATTAASARSRAEQAPALTRIDIVMPAFDGVANAFYAKHRGFFRQQGLDARITILADVTQYTPALLSGDADFAPNSMGGLAIAKSRGAPVRLVASAALYLPLAPVTSLVARKGATIRGARDLVGKKVAIDSPNAIPHIAMRRWLKRNGVPEAEVDFRPIPFPQMLAALAQGDIDAAVIGEPYLTMALRQGATRVTNVFRVVCPKICLVSGWMARKDQDPTVAAKFRNAIQAASVWADNKANHRASAAILAKYTPIDAGVMRTMTRAYFAKRLVPGMGQPWIDAYAEFGVIPESFPAIQLVK